MAGFLSVRARLRQQHAGEGILVTRTWYQPRVAAASQPNTLKTMGFRSRL